MYKYAYLDFDIDDERAKLARGAAFVYYTSLRYGFSSNDLRLLGGSELPRITDFYVGDHEWKDKGEILVKRQVQGRVIFRLFVDKAPIACENFLRLCVGKEKDPMLKYKGTKIHRITSGFLQGGDMQFGNGSGGMSVWGKPFKDEKGGLVAKHDRRGVLSMGNSGKNSNSSQFFITFDKAPQCDGKHVVFGEVISGFDVLEAMESAEKQKRGQSSGQAGDDALTSIIVTDCGEYVPHKIPGAGYWLDFPDPEAYSGSTPVFMCWPRVCIVSPSRNVEEKFIQVLRNCCSFVSRFPIDSKEAAAEMVKSNAIDLLVVAGACKDLAPTFEEESLNNMVVITIPLTAKEDVFASWIKKTSWDCAFEV